VLIIASGLVTTAYVKEVIRAVVIVTVSGVARIRWEERAAQNYVILFVAHKMTQNNTPNKVHIAAIELPQLLSQNAK